MAIAFDADSNAAAGTGNFSWTHTPVGTPRGVVVMIAQTVGSGDEVTAVTYGGVAMAREATVNDTAGEPGRSYAYFLGSGIPSGAQTVAITVDATGSSKRPTCTTVTAGTDTKVEASATFGGDAANPSVTLATGAVVPCFCCGVGYMGESAVTAHTEGSGYTQILEHGFGSQSCSFIRRTAISTGGNVTLNWTAAAIDDRAVTAVAVREVPSMPVFSRPPRFIKRAA